VSYARAARQRDCVSKVDAMLAALADYNETFLNYLSIKLTQFRRPAIKVAIQNHDHHERRNSIQQRGEPAHVRKLSIVRFR
jgi:hypothetical protein